MEVNIATIIVVESVVYDLVVFERHGNAAELKALNEFLELKLTIVVDVEASEGMAIVLELLFETLMD